MGEIQMGHPQGRCTLVRHLGNSFTLCWPDAGIALGKGRMTE